MRKILLWIMMVLLVVLGMLGLASCGGQDNSSNSTGDSSSSSLSNPSIGLEFKLNAADACYQVVGIDGFSGTELVIPSQYKNLPVKSIGENAFCGWVSLTNVILPDSITEIGKSAFSDCSHLISVVMSAKVTKISEQAFDNCTSLASLYYQGTLEDWEKVAIEDDNAALLSAAFYEYSEEQPLQNGAYWHYDNAGKAVVWENIYSEGLQYAFTRGTQSYAVIGIGTCTDQEIVIPGIYDNVAVTSIWGYAFAGSEITSVIVPSSVTWVGNYAFSDCTNLTSVTLPQSIVSIGGNAFTNCSSLRSIQIPKDVSILENGLFFNCDNLENVLLPEALITIGNDVFSGCSKLVSIDLPNGVTSIGGSAFLECVNLVSIHLPDSVTSIGANAFEACKNLTSIKISNNITSIAFSAFYDCTKLEYVYYRGSLQSWGEVSIDSYNDALINATRYDYSETKPTQTGNYWHYDDQGEIVVW